MNTVPWQEVAIPPGIVVFNFWALPAPDNTEFYGALVVPTEDLLSKFEGLSATFKQQRDNSAQRCGDIVLATLNDIVKAVETKGGANRHMLDPQEMMTDFIMLIWAMSESGYSPEEMNHLRMGGGFSLSLMYLDEEERETMARSMFAPGRKITSPVVLCIDLDVCKVRACDVALFAKRLDDARALTATIH